MDPDKVLMWTAIFTLALALLGSIAGIIKVMFDQAQKLLVAPLTSELAHLSERITTFGNQIDKISEALNDTRERIAKVESSAKQAHHRLDDLNKRLEDHVNREGM